MVDWRCVLPQRQPRAPLSTLDGRRTFVLTIRNRLVLELGRSPVPTRATSEVQKSISTIPTGPSSAADTFAQSAARRTRRRAGSLLE